MGGRGGGVALGIADGVEGGETPRPQPRMFLLRLLWFGRSVPMDQEESLHSWLKDKDSV